uniref:Uncharacterized protein n=1 Tax=Candidatus Methanogaster sp. ANME-2c ERB4 TaxID=2759911 RepID=A0A7G9YDH6_9EURY|nr:hypothetical protein FINKGBGL_00010 [Methanosarcinales archaeon ANME-2c ERB4]
MYPENNKKSQFFVMVGRMHNAAKDMATVFFVFSRQPYCAR